MNNEIEFKFGDYAIIEQKRHGVPNEMFVHKVIGQLRSNSWVDVPVQSPATETLHDEMEDVCWCICCGVDETEVRAYRVNDLQRSNLSPDGGEVTALALTLQKSREASGCPAGVDLQDWVKQLAEESLQWQMSIPPRVVAGIKADGRVEGAHFVANRMLAAWDAGFIEDSAKNAADIARMILTSTEFMADAPEGDFDRSFADGILENIAKQLREGADK
ncbi:hypothetical protein [Klebsiella aerogenes]|uniref:hypothetical protein n=1 Tax=Klebsiella aerogenes TaxID=548 RepID=UPI000AC4BC14|nr:hypothetical protein [Klebsiella aerogenes]